MAKVTDRSYVSGKGSAHVEIGEMPNVNLGHNPRTGKAEALNLGNRTAVESLKQELDAILAFDDSGQPSVGDGPGRSPGPAPPLSFYSGRQRAVGDTTTASSSS